MRLSSPLLTCLMFILASQAYCLPTTTSENDPPTSQIIPPAPIENNPIERNKELNKAISPNLPGNLPSDIPNSTTSQPVSPEADNSSALTQLMNSKAFQGLSICTVDPWKGLEYAKNLELEYLRNLLPPNVEIHTPEQQASRKEISELMITSGRELQEIREKCLDTEETPDKSEVKAKRDGDEDGIP